MYLGKFHHDLTWRPKPIDDGEWIRGIIPFYGRTIQVSEIFSNLPRVFISGRKNLSDFSGPFFTSFPPFWYTQKVLHQIFCHDITIHFCTDRCTKRTCTRLEYYGWLVVFPEHDWIIFHLTWEVHHPNWRSHIFQRGGSSTNQYGYASDGASSHVFRLQIPCACQNHTLERAT